MKNHIAYLRYVARHKLEVLRTARAALPPGEATPAAETDAMRTCPTCGQWHHPRSDCRAALPPGEVGGQRAQCDACECLCKNEDTKGARCIAFVPKPAAEGAGARSEEAKRVEALEKFVDTFSDHRTRMGDGKIAVCLLEAHNKLFPFFSQTAAEGAAKMCAHCCHPESVHIMRGVGDGCLDCSCRAFSPPPVAEGAAKPRCESCGKFTMRRDGNGALRCWHCVQNPGTDSVPAKTCETCDEKKDADAACRESCVRSLMTSALCAVIQATTSQYVSSIGGEQAIEAVAAVQRVRMRAEKAEARIDVLRDMASVGLEDIGRKRTLEGAIAKQIEKNEGLSRMLDGHRKTIRGLSQMLEGNLKTIRGLDSIRVESKKHIEALEAFVAAVTEYGSFNGPDGSHWEAVLDAKKKLAEFRKQP